MFGVTSGKVLGYVVSKKCIKVDPAKLQAIMEMPPPRNIIQLGSLKGWLQSIRRFITQLANKCLPFPHLLHKNFPFRWEDRCEESFSQLKQYMMNPFILVPPIAEKLLLLNISTIKVSLGALLAQVNSTGKERVIYYINKTLNKYELNYMFIEQVCVAVVFSS